MGPLLILVAFRHVYLTVAVTVTMAHIAEPHYATHTDVIRNKS